MRKMLIGSRHNACTLNKKMSRFWTLFSLYSTFCCEFCRCASIKFCSQLPRVALLMPIVVRTLVLPLVSELGAHALMIGVVRKWNDNESATGMT